MIDLLEQIDSFEDLFVQREKKKRGREGEREREKPATGSRFSVNVRK